MGAADATLTEALGLLRGQWAVTTSSVLHDGTVIWVGSGVSREKFPDLYSLLLGLFDKLHQAQDPNNPACPYRATTRHIIEMTTRKELDEQQAPMDWPVDKRNDLLGQLVNHYADVLGVNVQVNGGSKSIVWDILKLDKTYSDVAVTPDAEHRFLAILIAEGAVTEVITTNWDPLIERAYSALQCGPPLEVVACFDELTRPGQGALILKIHGCADRMKIDPKRYRQYMVASRNDINSWVALPIFQPFKDKVRTMLRRRPALFIGISGQDFNIQAQCVATTIGGDHYPMDPPRIIFTVENITSAQRPIFDAMYGDGYTQNAATIEASAALPLFGKPLLGALFVLLVNEKLECLLSKGENHFSTDELRGLARSLPSTIEQFLTTRYNAIPDIGERWSKLSTEIPWFISRMLGLYRQQSMPASSEAYQPIHRQHTDLMRTDPNLADANLHWLVLAVALFQEGFHLGKWNLLVPSEPTGEDGQLRAALGTDEVSVFFLNNAVRAQRELEINGVLRAGSGRRVLLVYPNGSRPDPIRRSPARKLPGTGISLSTSELWIEDVSSEFSTNDEIIDSIHSALMGATVL